ncbi:MAG: Na+/H+ antiporter subunit E [Alcanivoracaceae bacterium]|jgi:multicomponent K+:H+ antiporter subunit E|nr:Na+/H+ antiporter subunit E [Alcanivoracaceae bacterium]
MKRWLPSPMLSLMLWGLWLLLANDFSAGQMVLGLIFAWLIPVITEPFWLRRPRIQKPGKLVAFVLLVHRDILVANMAVAKLILRNPQRLRPAFVEVPLDTDNEFVITVLASVVSLTPGTVSADISADRRTLLVHSLDVEDRASLVASIKQRYEAPLKEIFGC